MVTIVRCFMDTNKPWRYTHNGHASHHNSRQREKECIQCLTMEEPQSPTARRSGSAHRATDFVAPCNHTADTIHPIAPRPAESSRPCIGRPIAARNFQLEKESVFFCWQQRTKFARAQKISRVFTRILRPVQQFHDVDGACQSNLGDRRQHTRLHPSFSRSFLRTRREPRVPQNHGLLQWEIAFVSNCNLQTQMH